MIFNYPEDTILNQKTAERRPYENKTIFTNNIHLGQLKLFSNELQFILSYIFNNNLDPRKQNILLYVGAGKGHHLYYLAKMFPTLNFHLFDCRFDDKLYTLKNIKIEKRYFENEDVEYYSRLSRDPDFELFFISDIRDLTLDSKKWNIEEQIKIIEDMNLQKRWVEEINAKASMLKFKLPYPDPEVIDYLKGKKFEYLDGIIYKQPWAKGKSIETRLVIPREYIENKKYDLMMYEEQMFYHNAIIRQKDYVYPLSDKLVGIKVNKNLTINARYDCAFIITLLVEYYHRSKPNLEEKKLIKNILHILNYVTFGNNVN